MNINEIVLTPEQIREVIQLYGVERNVAYDDDYYTHNTPEFMRVSLATVKKYHKWLNEDCDEHPHQVYPTGTGFTARIECPDCMKAVDKTLEAE